MIVLYLRAIVFYLMTYQNSLDYAKQLDQEDPISYLRNQFHIPRDKHGKEWLYFTGNSLGLQPKITSKYIEQELDDWANFGVEGHFEAKNPWLSYHELLTDTMAKVVGAKPIEVVVMNTLTTNLHLLMVSFYQPTKTKYKIIIESDAFPSDRYAVQSQLSFHGFDPGEALIEWKPKEGKELLELEDLKSILDIHGDDNKFKGSQKQDTSSITHSIIAAVYGDNNDVYVRQMQNGNKSLNLTINSDWNEASIVQKKAGAHTATINLTGTQPTTLNLTQTGDTNQSYSLTQNCVTVGGCSVSITQQ